MRSILVTGGAGFIGSHVTDELEHGYDVRILDALVAQVHFRPEVALEDGIPEPAGWLETQTAVDRVDDATAELVTRGLAR
jgi:dTDP-L-rhamnose 4-epimerase